MRISRSGWVTRIFVTWVYMIEHFRSTNADADDSVPEYISQLKTSVKQTIQQESFKGWQTWEARYPTCNSDTNPYLSPIEINSKKAIRLNTARAIIVSSEGLAPENCLFLSSVYTTNYMEIDAGVIKIISKIELLLLLYETGLILRLNVVVNIIVAPACQDFLSYISGAGEGAREYRYFKRALFYFTTSPVETPQQSLHTIDGKQFDMEIVMEFAESSGENSTLIHLMVEALSPEETSANVAFELLEFAVSDLKEEIAHPKGTNKDRKTQLKKLEESCLKAEKEYFGATENKDKEKEYFKACSTLVEARTTPINYVPISSPFQISWLFPLSGGYYLYNGSRSIPDCEPVQHSIVFEKPLQITTDQLAVFQSIPSRSGANVDQMIPALRSAEDRKVWYVNKEVYYRQTDGLRLPSEPRPDIISSENRGGHLEFRITIYCTFSMVLIALYL
ncbi:Carbonic anhydrase 15 [Orchesella cincta]|uniref:Carbonic anhydrase 15 n=1 Tax=Orchesella cincta TaxID=48709 RepID=A0A1D2NDH0_ORCCI|nr:Carbonic anhydrase 15 [Orchesella cincta]